MGLDLETLRSQLADLAKHDDSESESEIIVRACPQAREFMIAAERWVSTVDGRPKAFASLFASLDTNAEHFHEDALEKQVRQLALFAL